jgi:hypothetical protein
MKQRKFPSRKIKVTLALPPPLIERMRTVVYWTPTLTLAAIAETGIEQVLRKLEKRKRFRKRRGKIRVGRPPKDRSRR